MGVARGKSRLLSAPGSKLKYKAIYQILIIKIKIIINMVPIYVSK
jgi:hypothetical protein